MRLRVALSIFLCLALLTIFPINSRSEDSSLCFDLEDSQKLFLCIEKEPILQEKILVLEQRIKNLEKENELLKRNDELQGKLIELTERERDIYKNAFDREKDLTDRALKLAETSKPKMGIWYTVIGVVAAFAIGLAIGL